MPQAHLTKAIRQTVTTNPAIPSTSSHTPEWSYKFRQISNKLESRTLDLKPFEVDSPLYTIAFHFSHGMGAISLNGLA